MQQKTQETFATESNLAQIIDKIVNIDAQSIVDRIEQIEQNRKFNALVDVSEFTAAGVDLTIYCNKTGQPTGAYSIPEFVALKNIHGESRAMEIIAMRQTQNIAAHWLYTDDTALDALAKNDPYGYSVFAASKILFVFNIEYRKHGQWQHAPRKLHVHWHLQKVAGYAAAQNIPLNKLVELNELMSRYLTIVQSAAALGIVEFTHIPLADALTNYGLFIREIRNNISKILHKAREAGKLREHVTYDDILSLRKLYRGHTNFARQGRLRQMTDMEVIEMKLAPFLAELDKAPRYIKGREPKVERSKPQNTAFKVAPGTQFNLGKKNKDVS